MRNFIIWKLILKVISSDILSLSLSLSPFSYSNPRLASSSSLFPSFFSSLPLLLSPLSSPIFIPPLFSLLTLNFPPLLRQFPSSSLSLTYFPFPLSPFIPFPLSLSSSPSPLDLSTGKLLISFRL